jgi:hypothetical protein
MGRKGGLSVVDGSKDLRPKSRSTLELGMLSFVTERLATRHQRSGDQVPRARQKIHVSSSTFFFAFDISHAGWSSCSLLMLFARCGQFESIESHVQRVLLGTTIQSFENSTSFLKQAHHIFQATTSRTVSP